MSHIVKISSDPGRTSRPTNNASIRHLAFGLIALLVLALPMLPVPEFVSTQMNYIGIDALVVLGLVLLTGVCGLTSFGQAAFVGIGAYATAYVTTALAWSPWAGLLV